MSNEQKERHAERSRSISTAIVFIHYSSRDASAALSMTFLIVIGSQLIIHYLLPFCHFNPRERIFVLRRNASIIWPNPC
jgi:hypothetical protein